jgi:hypothetical protein
MLMKDKKKYSDCVDVLVQQEKWTYDIYSAAGLNLVPRVYPSVIWERPWLRLVTCFPDSGR